MHIYEVVHIFGNVSIYTHVFLSSDLLRVIASGATLGTTKMPLGSLMSGIQWNLQAADRMVAVRQIL